MPDVDIVVVCCGGGGLLAGVSSYLANFAVNKVRIFGVEPENACGMFKSLQASSSSKKALCVRQNHGLFLGRRGKQFNAPRPGASHMASHHLSLER